MSITGIMLDYIAAGAATRAGAKTVIAYFSSSDNTASENHIIMHKLYNSFGQSW